MSNRNLGLASAAMLLGGISLVALAQSDGLEVTLQVLDDVSDISGVLMAVEQAADRRAPEARPAEERPRAGNGPAPMPAPADRESALGRELDREEESESELEDFDVPAAGAP
jgi:hypothetical protein